MRRLGASIRSRRREVEIAACVVLTALALLVRSLWQAVTE
jgi:hypothetical protein